MSEFFWNDAYIHTSFIFNIYVIRRLYTYIVIYLHRDNFGCCVRIPRSRSTITKYIHNTSEFNNDAMKS